MGQNLPWLSSSTIGPRDTAGKKVSPPIMTMTPIVSPMNMALSVRNVPRDAGTDVFGRQCTAQHESRDHDAEPAYQHVDPSPDVVKGSVTGETPKS